MFKSEPRRVDEILAQFPGPVRLAPNRRLYLLGILAAIPGIALFTAFLLLANLQIWEAIFAWFFLGLMALVIIGYLFQFRSGVGYLTLDGHGFEIDATLRRVAFPWNAAAHFRVVDLEFIHVILFDRVKADRAIPPSRFWSLSTQIFPQAFGMPHQDFARLMNEWRAKAVGTAAS